MPRDGTSLKWKAAEEVKVTSMKDVVYADLMLEKDWAQNLLAWWDLGHGRLANSEGRKGCFDGSNSWIAAVEMKVEVLSM